MKPFLGLRLHRLGQADQWEVIQPSNALITLDIVVVGRELCTFELFHATGSRRMSRRAAMLYARTAAPHSQPGYRAVPSGPDFAITWWDKAAVDRAIRDRFGTRTPGVIPEALAHRITEGWRQVRLPFGWDVQSCRNGALRFSTWRRTPLDNTAYDRLVRLLADDGPDTFPPKWDPFHVSGPRLWWRARPPLNLRSRAKQAGVLAILVSVAASAGLMIRADRIAEETAMVEARVRSLEARAGQSDFPEMQRVRQKLSDYDQLTSTHNPVSALAVAVAALQLYDILPQSFEADADSTQITIPYDALPLSRELASDLELAGAFEDVELTSTPNRAGIQIDMVNQDLDQSTIEPGPTGIQLRAPQGVQSPGGGG